MKATYNDLPPLWFLVVAVEPVSAGGSDRQSESPQGVVSSVVQGRTAPPRVPAPRPLTTSVGVAVRNGAFRLRS